MAMLEAPDLQRKAASACDDSPGRLCLNTSAACDGFSSAVARTIDHVAGVVSDVRLKARRMAASRDKRLEWQCEELDGNKALLEGCERQLCTQSDQYCDLDGVDVSIRTAGQVLDEWNPLPAHPNVVALPAGAVSATVLPVATQMSHLQLEIDSRCSIVSQPPCLRRGEPNVVTISCRDCAGDLVVSLTREDVSTRFIGAVKGWYVREVTVGDGVVHIDVRLDPASTQEVTLAVAVYGTRFDLPLQVCK